MSHENLLVMDSADLAIIRRTNQLFVQQQQAIFGRTDKIFIWLMGIQWIGCILMALLISPYTWSGSQSALHPHVSQAIFLGGLTTLVPIAWVILAPGATMTRHIVAIGQLLTSALLIHLSGGRIETHFHVFGSLAFLAFYRDWKVILTATVVVAADHFLRGMFWPQSVFGIIAVEPWRWVEHAGWVVFEDVFLMISIFQSVREMKVICNRQAQLEVVNARIEQTVADRTGELCREVAAHQLTEVALSESKQSLEAVIKASPVAIVALDNHDHVKVWNPAAEKLFGWFAVEVVGKPSPIPLEARADDKLSSTGSLQKSVSKGAFASQPITVVTPRKSPLPPNGSQPAPQGIEIIRARKDGSRIDVSVWTKILHDHDGHATGSINIFADITDKKKAEKEVSDLQKELMVTSHQAGMAEVATGVLHNVGNVLNSVNVSTNLISENLNKSRTSHLRKAMDLIRQHSADLGQFITDDPQGKQLPGYLDQLTNHLSAEQETLRKETDLLRQNIEHIKEIVSMQQGYAQMFGVVEQMCITDLVEDAIRLNAGALVRHDVELIRKFDVSPTIMVDRHKVLQVLVNLIRNAKYACDESGKKDKKLTIHVTNGGNSVKIAIIDNGIGIPAENLTRIFAHGFTTRKDGHGFGLHSGSLAAKEIGGSLTAFSEGTNLGATFTLELPLVVSEPAPETAAVPAIAAA